MSNGNAELEIEINTFTIDPDGWGKCAICNRHTIKGGNELATARLMADHLLTKHGVKVDLSGEVVPEDVEDEYATPMFIPPRRNGTAVTTPTRMDWGGYRGYKGRHAG